MWRHSYAIDDEEEEEEKVCVPYFLVIVHWECFKNGLSCTKISELPLDYVWVYKIFLVKNCKRHSNASRLFDQ